MTETFSTLPAVVSIAKDAILTGVAVIAAYVGLRGLNTWRRQLAGNAEYELAKNALTCLYKLRGVIGVVRDPFASYSQEPNLPVELLKDMNEKQKEWYAYAQMYEKRWSPVVEAKSQLDALLFEMEAVWGRESVKEFEPLNKVIAELQWAIQDHLEDRDPRRGRHEHDTEEIKRQRLVLFRRGSKAPDEYNARFEAAISNAEVVLKPYVLRHHK